MAKKKILITDGLAPDGIKILKDESTLDVEVHKGLSPSQLLELVPQAQCLVVRSATQVTAEVIAKGAALELIVRAGAGVDNIDVKTATQAKLPVMNTASANSNAAAEQTIALLFALARQVPDSVASLKSGKWERDRFKGFELEGKTLGVLGLGNIGRMVARKAVGLGMRVVGTDPIAKNLSIDGVQVVGSLKEVLKEADILTLHIPKSPETQNIIGSSALEQMKRGSYLINCARGGIVDERAVIAALDSGQLAGAAFDVFEKEPPVFPNALIAHTKVICAPHLGASTLEAQDRVALTAARQIVAFFTRGERNGIVNPV